MGNGDAVSMGGPVGRPQDRRRTDPGERRAGDHRQEPRDAARARLSALHAATCSSRTCPASARRCWRARSRGRPDARFSASSSRRTCCPATSPASRSTTRRRATSSSAPGRSSAQIVLADEINRATPKTQSALLEAMEERQVTVDGVTHKLPDPFMVMATQNPIEYEGTFPLPEAQLDRFLMRVHLGYPSADGRSADHGRAAGRAPDRLARAGDDPRRKSSSCRRRSEASTSTR